ncbi:MAG: hypothetical protein V4544_00005, partial [Pseudomonadota bacterium]
MPSVPVAISGTGTAAFTGSNTNLTGAVTMGTGSIATIASGSNLGSGALGLTGATVTVAAGGSLSNAITSDGDSALNLQTTGGAVTVNGSLSGAMPVNVNGTGVANINSTNTNTGAVTVGAATVNLASGKNLGSGSLGLTDSTINFAGTTTLNNSAVTVAGTGTTTLTTAASGITTFGNAITQTAASTLNINGAGATVINGVITTPAGGTVNLGGTGQTTINAAMVSNAAASLNVSSGKTVSVTVANPNLAGTVAVGSSATLNLGASANLGSAGLNLTAATVNLATGRSLNAVTLIGATTSTINTTGTSTLSGALTSGVGSTLNVTGGTTNINSTNAGLLGTVAVGSGATVNLGSGANLGTGALSLTGSTINFTNPSGGNSTTLTNSGIAISGNTTLTNNVGSVYLGSGALSGGGTLNISGGAAPDNITYITANNSGFTGAVRISSKVNIGNGSNLGTGLITLNTGNGLILGSTTLNNAFSIASASSFTVNAGETANLTGAFSGTNPITVSSNPANRGILKLSGASSGYTGAIGATNINLLINGPTGATVNAGTNSVIGGTGSMGDLALTNSAIIKPGTETALGSISASTLTTDSGARYYVRIGADGRSSQINVTGNTTLTNLATDLLMGAGIYATGASVDVPVVINYPIMITGGTLTGDITDITWTAQAGLTIDVGRAATNNKAILLKLTATAPFTIGANQTAPGATTASIAPGHTIAIGSNDTTAPVSITSGGSVSTATLTTGTPIDLAGGTLANTTSGIGGSAKVLADAITVSGVSTLQTAGGSETKITEPITSGTGTTLNISGGGITTFSADNSSTMLGNIEVTAASSTINVANGANLGTGEFKLAAPGTTVNLGDATGINPTVAIKNTVVVDNAASFVVPTDVVATIEKVIAGSSVGGVAPDLTFSGPGKTNLTGTGTSTYDGTLRATAGNLAVNSDMRLADVNVSAGAIVSGVGTMKNLTLQAGGTFKPGNSIGTTPIAGNYTALTGSITTIEINNAGQSSRGVASGNIDLQGTHILKILMNTDNGGAYPAGKIDYNILEAGGTLSIDQFDVRFVPQTGMTFKIGKLNQPGSAKDHKALILQYENTGAPIAIGATQVDGNLPGSVNTIVAGDITIDSTDIVSPDSGLGDVSTAPIADQVELTNLVFQNNPTSDDAVSSAVGDAFRFKG